MDKYEYTALLAAVLRLDESRLTGSTLVRLLNEAGFRTNAGRPYVEGGRGIYRHLDVTYDRLEARGMHTDAVNVAERFTDQTGNPAWDR